MHDKTLHCDKTRIERNAQEENTDAFSMTLCIALGVNATTERNTSRMVKQHQRN